jgi:aminopeptidase N
MADEAPFNPDAAGAGRRALRSGALAMFAAGNAVEGGARAHRQFAEADNMTTRLGALATIATIPGARRERALETFARRFAAEPLILDKWFALQAQIPERRTLERVRGLMTHHAFSLGNPNRVRALIGGFSANATQFNRADGAGYDLLCEIVLTLDPTNPQIAARLLTALRSWKSLESVRQAKAEAVLRRIGDQPDLSTDVRDIVTRSLA